MTTGVRAAGGDRIPFESLPLHLRQWVDDALGSPVASARTQTGGFSAGVASRVGRS